MTDKQPEALRRADELMKYQNVDFDGDFFAAAAELRRLHEVNAELVELLQQARKHLPIAAASWNEEPEYAIHVKAVLALVTDIDAAISKAAGGQP